MAEFPVFRAPVRRRAPRLALVILALSCGLWGAGCGKYEEPLPRRDRLHFPVGLALHQGGRYLYVVNSNFDTRYRPAQGGTVSVIDTDTGELLPEAGPYIPSFGGYIKLNEAGTKAYITARQGNAIVALDVAEQGGGLFCDAERTSSGNLSASSDACVHSRVPDVERGALIPADPFGLEVATVRRTPPGGEEMEVDVLGLSHLRGDEVTAISLPNQSFAGATLRNASLLQGASQVVRRPGTMDMYALGRNTNVAVIFSPYINERGEVEAIVKRDSFTLNHVSTQVDARGAVWAPDGRTLYVATRSPDALLQISVEPADPETGAGVSHQITRMIPLDDQPSDVVHHRMPGGKTLLYVPCYDARTIQVVDPDAGAIVKTIRLDAQPYQMVVEQSPAHCNFAGDRCRAYITLFADSASTYESCETSDAGCGSVAVLDLDPASPRYHQIIQKIR